MADEDFKIDFSSIREQAAAELDANPFYKDDAPAPGAKVETPTTTTTPEGDPLQTRVKGSTEIAIAESKKLAAKAATEVPNTPEAPVDETEEADEAVAPESLNLAEAGDKLVTIKVDGKDQVVPLKEALAGYSRTQKFTKEMQALRTREEAITANETAINTLVSEREAMLQLVSNPQKLQQYMQAAFGQAAAAVSEAPAADDPFSNPDEIVTVAQARQLAESMVSKRLAAFEQQIAGLNTQIDNKLQSNTKELQDRQAVAKYSESITSALGEIFEAHPVLKGDSFAEDIIRFEVGRMKPKTLEEAIEAFRTVAQSRAESLESHFTSINKVKVARKAKLDKAIEPAGGTGPQIQPFDYHGKDGKVDWNKLKSAARDMLG